MNIEIIDNLPVENSVKPPLLFVHGMWHGAWCWQSLFLPFAKEHGYEAYAFSFSGHGNSLKKKALNLMSINNYVEELSHVINGLDREPILVGHSMGAYVIQKYLEDKDAMGAILIGPVPPFGVWGGTMRVVKTFPWAFLKANILMDLKHIIAKPKQFRKILLSDNITDETMEECRKKIGSESLRAYIDMLGLNLVKTKKINTPIMIIGGEKDFAVPRKDLNKTAEIYGVKPVVFDNMAHNIMLEPESMKVMKAMDDWIGRLNG